MFLALSAGGLWFAICATKTRARSKASVGANANDNWNLLWLLHARRVQFAICHVQCAMYNVECADCNLATLHRFAKIPEMREQWERNMEWNENETYADRKTGRNTLFWINILKPYYNSCLLKTIKISWLSFGFTIENESIFWKMFY